MRFKWTPIRVRDAVLWGFGFPFFVYTLIKNENVRIALADYRVPARKQSTTTCALSPSAPPRPPQPCRADQGRSAEWTRDHLQGLPVSIVF